MNEFAELILERVLWATVLLSIAFVAASIFCRQWKAVGNQTGIMAWFLVILCGCLVFEVPVDVAWHPAPPESTSQITAVIDSAPRVLETSETFSASREDKRKVGHWWMIFMFVVWAVGVFLCLAVSIGRYFVLAVCVRRLSALKYAEAGHVKEMRQVQAETGVRRSCRLLVSKQSGPFVCRLWREFVIVVPESLWLAADTSQRKAILRHELNHVRRYDLCKVACARWLVSFQWFNPLTWLALQKFCESIELACDESAKGTTKAEQIEYSRALLQLIELRNSQPRFSVLTLSATGSPLHRRFEQILKPKGNEMKLTRMLVVMLFVAIAMVGVLRVQLVAQEAEGDSAKQLTAQKRAEDDPDSPPASTDDKITATTYMVADLVVPVQLERQRFDGDQWVSSKPPQSIDIDYSELIDLIQSTIEPDSWSTKGGTARITGYDSNISLIITQTQPNHQRIQNLLTRLREINAITLLFEGSLVVMSDKDFADSLVKVEGKQSIISVQDARMLSSFAKVRDSSECFPMPRLNIYNGQAFHYEIAENESGLCEYGGVDLKGMNFQAAKMASQDVVMLTRIHATTGIKEDIGVEPASYVEVEVEGSKHPAFVATGDTTNNTELLRNRVPDGAFIAIDVSDRLIEKEGRQAFLILHVDIRKWK